MKNDLVDISGNTRPGFAAPQGPWRFARALASLAVAGLTIAGIGWLLSPLLTFLGTLYVSCCLLAFICYIIHALYNNISGKGAA